jgi:aminoglycoside phosphotransferase (APT) family kinase protein
MVNLEDVEKAIHCFDSSLDIEDISDISGQNRETYDVELSSGENLICCFNRDKPEWFKIEKNLVELVNQKTDVPTQKILYSDFSSEDVPEMFHIAEKIEGSKSEQEYEELLIENKEKIVQQIGYYLAEIHKNIQFKDFGRLRYRDNSLEVEKYSWRELVQEIAEEYIEEMKDTRFEDLPDEMRDYVQKNLHLLAESNPVLVHYDVAVDNIIREGTDVKAILDWERAFVGQPEWDLAHSEVRFILQFVEDEKKVERLKKAFYDSYQEVRSLEDGWRTRKEYYGMIQLFHGMKYFENWTERQNYSIEEKIKEEEWHRNHFKKNNKKLEY